MSNDRAKGRKAPAFYLTRVGRIVLACILVAVAIWPMGVQPQATQAAPVYAPQTPTPPPLLTPTPTTTPPLAGEGGAVQAPHPPPSPDNLPPEVEQARARQAMEAALAKYLRYWGPRYQVAPIEVAMEGEWAHGVAQWQSKTKTLSGPIHILANRLPDGTWQALLPGSDGLYRQWVDAVPESLVPAGEKSQLRTQAAEADAMWQPQAARAVPPAPTAMSPGKEGPGEPVEPVSGLVQPTATPMPIGTLTQTGTCASDELRPQLPVEVEAKVRATLQTELDVLHASRGLHWDITSVWGQDNWAVVECDVRTEDDAPVATEGRIALARKIDLTWTIAMPGSQEYEAWLSEVPEYYLALEAKRFLANWQVVRVEGVTAQVYSSSEYRLPFPNGTRVYVTQDSAAHGGPVDMVGLDSSTVVAARDGWIRAVQDGYWQCCCNSGCANCNNYIVMEHSDGEWTKYFHIAQGSAQNAKNNLNNWVTASTVLATQGDIGYSCGSGRAGTGCNGYNGSNCGIHVHFEVRDGRYGAYRTPRFCGVPGEIVQTSQTYTASSCNGDTCSAPSLNSPNDGYVHTPSDRTITFNWSPPSNCTPDGYTFRVKTVPDMDSGGTTIFDEGQGGTQVTKQFGSEWDNTDLYWSVRACKPCTPYHPGPWAPSRRFRIEPGSLQGNWEARYDQGDTCWWDPNCNMNPRCTETINGPELHKDWGSNAPCGGMDGDNWVGDFRATINFPAGDYVFHLEHDDGVKLWLNGQNIQDRGGSGSGPVCPAHYLSGDNQLRVLLREEGGDARVHLTWDTDTSVCMAPPIPDPPVLDYPPDGARLPQSTDVTLRVKNTAHAAEYQFELFGDPIGMIGSGWQSSNSWPIGQLWVGSYGWHAEARNSSGQWSGWSDWWTFTIVPNTPTNLSASAVSSSQINLTWTDPGGDMDGFRIYRDGAEIETVGSGTSSYQDTGLSCENTYSYYFVAYKGAYESDPSNTDSATTQTCPSPIPDPPVLDYPSDGVRLPQSTDVTLRVKNTAHAVEYQFELFGDPIGMIGSGWQSGTSWPVGQLWVGTYSYHAEARNSNLEWSGWSDWWTFTIVPNTPTNLSASAVSDSRIDLTWSNPGGDMDGFRIYRDGVEIETVGSGTTSYQDTGLSNYTTYSYYIVAYKGSIESDPSNTASATTLTGCGDSAEPNDTYTEATPLDFGQSRSANICLQGDYDFYEFTGTAGQKIVVDIDAQVNGSPLDPYVSLFDSDGTTILAEHDDEVLGVRRDSHLGYELSHDGTYYIRVRAWDHPSVGGTDHFYTIYLLTDNTNPTAEITSLGNDAWLDSSLETIIASASDNESGVSRVEFWWHDADWQNSDWIWLGADWDGGDGWIWDFDTSSLTEQRGGAFYILAFDWAGSWTGAAVWNLGIDRTPPTATADVSLMYGDAPFLDFYVWWSGSDNLSGVASYDIQYRDGSSGTWTNLLTDTTETYYRFVGQDGHTYYFRARARDYAGNMGTYASGDGDVEHTVQICPTSADAYEPDNSYTVAETITTNGTWQSHNFHVDGDQDWVEFTATAGITYTLVTTNTGGHADTVLYLYESDGNTLIDSNNNGPDNWPASRLEWGATRGSTYYVRVEHWDPYAYGCTTDYGLSIAETGTFEVSNNVYLPVILRNAR